MPLIHKKQMYTGPRGPAGADGNPLGTVISFVGKTPPDGYLICDGAVYDISFYPAFANFIKEQFGSFNHFGGDGETTFGVPDLRNLFLRGYHGEAEEKLSGEIGEKQEATEFPYIAVWSSNNWGNYGGINKQSMPINTDSLLGNGSARGISTQYKTPNEFNYSSYTSRPVNTAVLYCIKAFEPNNRGDEYSTEEIRIGTWIDGKPLYRKVLKTTLQSSTNLNQLNITFDNVDTITPIRIDAYVLYKGDATTYNQTSYTPVPTYWDNNYKIGFTFIAEKGICSTASAAFFGDPAIIIFEYTKTTD